MKEELIKKALEKWYILGYKIYEAQTRLWREWVYKMYLITETEDWIVMDWLNTPNIQESWVPEENLEERINSWIDKQKVVINLEDNMKETILQNLLKPVTNTYNLWK